MQTPPLSIGGLVQHAMAAPLCNVKERLKIELREFLELKAEAYIENCDQDDSVKGFLREDLEGFIKSVFE